MTTTETYSKNEVIIKEGEKGNRAFVINKGHVEIKKNTIDKNSAVIAILGPGQIFGEMCLFDDKQRSASAYAMGDVELSVIEKAEFIKYLENTPPELKVIIELLLKRIRQTSSLVALLKTETQYTSNNDETLKKNIENADFPT